MLGTDAFDTSILKHDIAAMTSLKSISVAYCYSLDDEKLVNLLSIIRPETRKQITNLNLHHCTNITNACVPQVLQMFPSLSYLNIGACVNLTDVCVASIVKYGKNFKGLVLVCSQ